jgi:hypothetical protein
VVNPREVLRALVAGAMPGAVITVRADWIAELVADIPEPKAQVEVDLTAAEVARLMARDEKTVASWCRVGLLSGAYRLRGREWRIPRASLAAFQRGRPGA